MCGKLCFCDCEKYYGWGVIFVAVKVVFRPFRLCLSFGVLLDRSSDIMWGVFCYFECFGCFLAGIGLPHRRYSLGGVGFCFLFPCPCIRHSG